MTTEWLSWLVFSFYAATAWQIAWWLLLAKAAWRKSAPPKWPTEGPGVSIIICARNEADRLIKNLPHICTQTYKPIEIIVVDDASIDKTQKILTSLSCSYKNLRTIKITNKTIIGKKQALNAGIRAATYDWLLFTDADCRPASTHWVAGMMAQVRQGAAIVLGIGLYEREAGWLNRFIRFETALTALQYCAAAFWHAPYMGVGRNLLYHKSVFKEAKGFSEHLNLASGDDDLLVNAVGRKFKTAAALHPQTFTLSEPKKTITSWYYQKCRHFTAADKYKRSHQIVLASVASAQMYHYLSGSVLFAIGLGQIALTGWSVKLLALHAVMWPWLRRIGQSDLMRWLWILDGALALYYGFFGLKFWVTRKTNSW